jgi:hypothetical protein
MMLPMMIILVRFEIFDVLNVATDASFAVATLNPATMEILQLFRGDSVIVRYVCLLFGSISATDSGSIVERNDVIPVWGF